jgi:hypothetical protein
MYDKSILCIASCGKEKIWNKNPHAGPTKAQDVYIGSYAKRCAAYAKEFYPSSWCILSAKHGFLLQMMLFRRTIMLLLTTREQIQSLSTNSGGKWRRRI